MPPLKKEGEKKDDTSNNMEGKGIASRIIGPFKPVSTRVGIIWMEWFNLTLTYVLKEMTRPHMTNYVTFT